ncbi:hypothetical protein [Bernardetia sp.]|uniref:hypothetical protein n=1 Tax=Bernardetia sp. TaxID=1937974 RepID=UPI0025B8BD39|nr:hypothetical protein [Bernardetia sp.]
MVTIALVWEIALTTSLLALLLMLQDWSKFWLFKKYKETSERKKDERAAEKLLDDLPTGVVRYRESKIPQK